MDDNKYDERNVRKHNLNSMYLDRCKINEK